MVSTALSMKIWTGGTQSVTGTNMLFFSTGNHLGENTLIENSF